MSYELALSAIRGLRVLFETVYKLGFNSECCVVFSMGVNYEIKFQHFSCTEPFLAFYSCLWDSNGSFEMRSVGVEDFFKKFSRSTSSFENLT